MQILQYSESIDRMFSLLTIGKDNKMVANTIDIGGCYHHLVQCLGLGYRVRSNTLGECW